ncbi:putative Rho-type GTPase-activating protein 3 [Grifola frondosa]|uniref:Putative Rho-type GTPase-activating protein 3 n=1 Tax=Grifola frondosa TaxID=5627 RepID=A0A1C7M2U9_GRIFR|nr:putative Rho-type GTPase-activating protein 3 [Grifola frondosa]
MTDVASQNSAAASDSALLSDNRFCPGCKNSVVDENGGVVVAFGQSFFHVDCFKCAKCQNQVTADTNLLLLSDGSPICANCSYCCNVCKQPILDEAIMTGEDSYHAHCFKCKREKGESGREKAAAGLAGNPAVGRDASKLRNEIAREPQTNGTSSSQVSPQSQARSSDTGSPAVSTTASHTGAKPLSRSDSDQHAITRMPTAPPIHLPQDADRLRHHQRQVNNNLFPAAKSTTHGLPQYPRRPPRDAHDASFHI